MRGRNPGRRNQSSRPQNFESNGPEVKVRGNAQQVVEKYLQLARDASTAGDPIRAENYLQHAEHYYRVQTANGGGDHRQGGRTDDTARNASENGSGIDSAGNGASEPSRQPPVTAAARVDVPDGVKEPESSDGPTPEAS